MKEQRRVFQKINKINEKTELETQKVEFALIDDVKARSKALNSDMRLITTLEVEFFKTRRMLIGAINNIKSTSNAQSKDIDKAIQSLKDLGMDTSEMFKYKKQHEDIRKEAEVIEKKVR